MKTQSLWATMGGLHRTSQARPGMSRECTEQINPNASNSLWSWMVTSTASVMKIAGLEESGELLMDPFCHRVAFQLNWDPGHLHKVQMHEVIGSRGTNQSSVGSCCCGKEA